MTFSPRRRLALIPVVLLAVLAACKFVESKFLLRISGFAHRINNASTTTDGRILGVRCSPDATGREPTCQVNVYEDGRILSSTNVVGRYIDVEAGATRDQFWMLRKIENADDVSFRYVIETWELHDDGSVGRGAALSFEDPNTWRTIWGVAVGRHGFLFVAGERRSGERAIGRFRIDGRVFPVARDGIFQTRRADNLEPFAYPSEIEADLHDGTVYVLETTGRHNEIDTLLAYRENLTRIDKEPLVMPIDGLDAYHNLVAIGTHDGEGARLEVYSGGTSTNYRRYDFVRRPTGANVMVVEPTSDTCGYLWTIGTHNYDEDLQTYHLFQRHLFCSDVAVD